MADYSYLLQYGVLGLWTITLLLDRYRTQKEFKISLDDNTEVMRNLTKTIELKVF